MSMDAELVNELTAFVLSILPDPDVKYRAIEIQVGGYDSGHGSGTADGKSVVIRGDPRMQLKSGDICLGVPIRPGEYFLAGKIR